MFDFAYAKRDSGPYPFYRGFFVSEVIQEGDVLLDIGCGDGFLTKRFYAVKCLAVDALDIDLYAIKEAQKHNSAENISYKRRDAVAEPFPREKYNVIVWDGAIGHFRRNVVEEMLCKIEASLSEGGIFVGSESLGQEGHDHLYFYNSLEEIYELFRPFFKNIQMRQVDYKLEWAGGFLRKEAYWRCSNDIRRLEQSGWRKYY